MKKLLVFLAAILLVFGVVGTASALVLDFDDVTTGIFAEIQDGYGGFDWENLWVVNGTAIGGAYGVGTVTPDYTAVNWYDPADPSPASIISDVLFDFEGAYLTAIWNPTGSTELTITVQGFSGDELLYTGNITVNKQSPTFFDVYYAGIDSLVFTSTGNFAMDNWVDTVSDPVPEPATMLLFGSGLIGLAAFGRKRLFKKS